MTEKAKSKPHGCMTCDHFLNKWNCVGLGCKAGAGVENCAAWEPKKPRHKFRAQPTETDGIKFSSKKEAAYYSQLKLRVRAGETLFFLRQVPFHLPGGVRYVVDFVEFLADGTVAFIDVKGMATPMYTAKKKMVESLYPITIKEV